MNFPAAPLPPVFNNPLFLLSISAWSMIWKGLALWRAAKNDQKYWFVGLLIINLLGIPEIIYLVIFDKENWLKKQVFKGKLGKS
jgi:methionyl-tRNA synthetase